MAGAAARVEGSGGGDGWNGDCPSLSGHSLQSLGPGLLASCPSTDTRHASLSAPSLAPLVVRMVAGSWLAEVLL